MTEAGSVKAEIREGVGEICFSHPKGNSLPGELLREIASQVDAYGEDRDVRVILLKSEGEKAFCGGASFDEFLAISNLQESTHFFSGFATLILSMRRSPKLVIARVQGKAVGGGVGVVAAADYALATEAASIRLSELALGIGPFIIGPAVERKVDRARFAALSIDAEWRDAKWAESAGLYSQVLPSIDELDRATNELSSKLAKSNPEAMAQLKSVLWEGTESWEELLRSRVGITAELALSDFAQGVVTRLKSK